jgi:hypothetical protein
MDEHFFYKITLDKVFKVCLKSITKIRQTEISNYLTMPRTKGEQIMSNEKITQDILDFNKNAIKMSFDALSSFTEQSAKAADQILGTVTNLPEEGKKAVDLFFKENQKGLASLKSSVDAGLDINWTEQEAPLKSLEAMEDFYSNAFTQAGSIQKETKALFKKTTDQLPKEAKPVVDFWTDAFNSNFQNFQSIVTKNFELAKKVLKDVAVDAPKSAAAKASK